MFNYYLSQYFSLNRDIPKDREGFNIISPYVMFMMF